MENTAAISIPMAKAALKTETKAAPKEGKNLAQLIANADNVDVRKCLEGDSLAQMQLKISREPDKGHREAVRSILDNVLARKAKGIWNCDDTSIVGHLFHLHSPDLYDCIRAYCALKLPSARVTSRYSSSVRVRFHPQGALGMSITSWREIHLVYYQGVANDNSDLKTDEDLGYDDIQRFGSFGEVCQEMSRVEALLVQRRNRIATSTIHTEIVSLVKAAPEFKTAAIWVLNDEGVCIELAPGVFAQVLLEREEKRASRRRGGKNKSGAKRHSGTRRIPQSRLADSLRVCTRNCYSTDYFGGANSCTARAALAHLKAWQRTHKRRRNFHTGVFTRLLGLDSTEPTIFARGPGWVATSIRAPSEHIHIMGDQYRCVRLISISAERGNEYPLLLWAAVMCQEDDKCAILMHERRYQDDSGCLPSAHRQQLRLDLIPGASDESVRRELQPLMGCLFLNYQKARALIIETITSNLGNGSWIYGGGVESSAVKDARRALPNPPTEFMGQMSWDEIYLCEPYNTTMNAVFDTGSWGLKLRNYGDDDKTVANSAKDVALMLAACLQRNKERAEKREREEKEREARLVPKARATPRGNRVQFADEI